MKNDLYRKLYSMYKFNKADMGKQVHDSPGVSFRLANLYLFIIVT